MSTRSSIRHKWDAEKQEGFHLYEDLLDEADGGRPVYLELTGGGIAVQVTAGTDQSPRVEIAIPRALAITLGLIPAAA